MSKARSRNPGYLRQLPSRSRLCCESVYKAARSRGRRTAMDEKRSRVVSIGEVMIEIARGEGRVSLGCGGDTFNTAVYLARAGIEVAFATAVGDDPYSDRILALAGTEGIA